MEAVSVLTVQNVHWGSLMEVADMQSAERAPVASIAEPMPLTLVFAVVEEKVVGERNPTSTLSGY